MNLFLKHMCDASVDSCALAFFATIMRFLGPGWIKLVICLLVHRKAISKHATK